MKKFWEGFARLLVSLLLILSFGLVAYIAYLYLRQNIVLKLDFTEYLDFFPRETSFIWYVLVAFLALVALSTIIGKINSTLLFTIGAIGYVAFGLYLIFNVDPILRTDPRYIFETAILFNKGDFSALTPGFFDHGQHYLWVYPDQLGLVSFYRVFTLLSTSVRAAFLFNLAMIIGIQFFQWRIVNLLFQSRKITNLTITLSFLFLPLLFLILWIYGDIPGLLGVLIAIYSFLKYRQSSHVVARSLYAILLCLGLGIACLVRSNYMIFAIALILLMLLDAMKEGQWRNLLLIPLVGLAMILPQKLVHRHYENMDGVAISKGTPKIAWVTMGLRDDQYPSQAGWWDAYTTFLMTWANDDYDTAEKMAKEELNHRIQALKADKGYAAQFFKAKFASTWAEPTIQSLQAGPIVSKEQYTHTPFLKSLYESGRGHHIYQLMMSIYLSCLYLSVLIVIAHQFISRKNKAPMVLFYPLIYIWGGVLFHLIWETKSRYTLPYVYLLLPLFAYGISILTQSLEVESRRERRGRKR